MSQGVRDSFWLQGMLAGLKGALDCIKAFSETDFTEDLKKFDVPTLIMHGDDDQIVPIGASAMLSSKLVKGAHAEGLPGRCRTACARPTRTRSTPTCWRSSKPSALRDIAIVEDVLREHAGPLGRDAAGCTIMSTASCPNLCLASARDEDAVDKVRDSRPGVPPDLGIWTDGTFDYLPPSVRLAVDVPVGLRP